MVVTRRSESSCRGTQPEVRRIWSAIGFEVSRLCEPVTGQSTFPRPETRRWRTADCGSSSETGAGCPPAGGVSAFIREELFYRYRAAACSLRRFR